MKTIPLCFCLALCIPIAAIGCSDNNTLQMGDSGSSSSSGKPGKSGSKTEEKIVTECNSDNCDATCCGNVCRDTTENHQHCGECDHACKSDQVCINSKCMDLTDEACGHGEKKCSGTCIDINRDSNNCGDCGKSCDKGQLCINGSCEIDCGNKLRCDGACYDPLTDREHCGNCNTKCSSEEACFGAICTTDCPEENHRLCDQTCVDIKSDPNRCGSCKNTCADSERCIDGACSNKCDEEGLIVCAHTCVDKQTNAEHCGGCGKPCAATERCQSGTCTSECDNAEDTICNHVCTNRMTDNDNCGECEHACESGRYCSEGSCINTCPEGNQMICDHVCTDILTDKLNCGSCGHACNEKEICQGGLCSCPADNPYCNLSCEEGQEPCGGNCTDVKNDKAHCGACGKSCGDTGICVNGKCIECAGKTFCNDNLCHDLMNDPDNCGSCGQACPNHVGCKDGQCTGCAGDYVDCDGDASNGCESTTAECECTNGQTKSCYYGPAGTENVGACKAGTMTCSNNKWGKCEGMITPKNDYQCRKESTDSAQNDLNCDGKVDGMEDYDKDGYTICDGDCCDISGQSDACKNIKNPEVIHPGIFETPGDKIDNNCNGETDEAPKTCAASYTQGANLSLATERDNAGLQLARAMDICHDAATDGFGIVSATVQSLHPGNPGNTAMSHAINVFSHLGNTPIITPNLGNSFAGISTGIFQNAKMSDGSDFIANGSIPAKYHSAHNNQLQTVTGCPSGNSINDALELKLQLKAPSNATGFQFDFRFFSHEYPEYICSRYNDFFIVLLTSTASGIPQDTNIVFDKNGNPVSVNNAFFTTCNPITCNSSCSPNYTKGCISGRCETVYGACPDGNSDLAAFTGGTYTGGATAWLTTQAPIVGGETFTLEFIIWDTGDSILDSAAIIDNFRWITDGAKVEVGTDFTEPRT